MNFFSDFSGSERPSKHLEVFQHLDEDEEWSKISQMHKRYFLYRCTDILLDICSHSAVALRLLAFVI